MSAVVKHGPPRKRQNPRCVHGHPLWELTYASRDPDSVTPVARDLALGLQLGYWTAEPRRATDLIELARTVEDLGFDSVWTGESWSSDAFSPLAAIAGTTSRVRLCTGIAQISARSPT
ncbi:MAG: LLM class flavin-dependent oxidoreductase, partial [Actinobacteria bacterium]